VCRLQDPVYVKSDHYRGLNVTTLFRVATLRPALYATFGGFIMIKISVKFEEDDYKKVADNCVYYGVSLSEYVRSCVLKKPIKNVREKSEILQTLNLIFSEIESLKSLHFNNQNVLFELDKIEKKLNGLLDD